MTGGTLLVATPGGHIDELFELAEQFCLPEGTRTWVTARTPQTSSLLTDCAVEWVRPIGSRQALAVLKSVPQAWRVLRQVRPEQVISTGAALAAPYLLFGRLMRMQCTYIESATRINAPSLTGRIAALIPGVRLHRQSTSGSRRRWTVIPSVFDHYSVEETKARAGKRVLVTVGTERFPFHRALDIASKATKSDDSEFYWQTGNTPVQTPLPGVHREWWPAVELREAADSADVIVTHAGVGSILMALRLGKCPVVIPRLGELGEHVDNHQVELARQLDARRLAIIAWPGDALEPLLDRAAALSVRSRDVMDTGFPS